MGWILKFINSSIGKKIVMAVTGVFLILFLLFHLGGNLTLYIGEETFNGYVNTLDIVKPLIRVVEVILAFVFIFHIFNGIKLWFENKKANPIKYKVNVSSKNSTFSSRTMIISGSIVFIFLITHLSTLWYAFNFGSHGADYSYYSIVMEWFSYPVYVLFYVIAMVLLGFHLNHGFQSAFQTFGWSHKKYTPVIEKLGTLYAIVMAVGFASMPIYFFISSLGGK
jgi:succinate dehydrogenase / fumarate reductase cytochrome b subunit